MSRVLLAFVVCLGLASSALAAVVRDTGGTTSVRFEDASNTGTFSQSFTIAASGCLDRLLVIRFTEPPTDVDPDSGSVKWNTSETMTAASGSPYNDNPGLTGYSNYVYYLKQPSTGTHTLTFTYDTSNEPSFYGWVSAYCNVNQTTPFGTIVHATNVTSPATVTATAGSTDLIIDMLSIGAYSSGITVGANQTAEPTASSNGWASYQSGADGGVMSWTFTGTNWNIVALPISDCSGSCTSTGKPQFWWLLQ